MKNKLVVLLLISIFILGGCQNKNNSATKTIVTPPNNSTVSQSQNNSSTIVTAGVASSSKRDNTEYNFHAVKPGTIPQLNQALKSQANDKLNSVINNINSSLQSLDDVKDIDLNSVN